MFCEFLLPMPAPCLIEHIILQISKLIHVGCGIGKSSLVNPTGLQCLSCKSSLWQRYGEHISQQSPYMATKYMPFSACCNENASMQLRYPLADICYPFEKDNNYTVQWHGKEKLKHLRHNKTSNPSTESHSQTDIHPVTHVNGSAYTCLKSCKFAIFLTNSTRAIFQSAIHTLHLSFYTFHQKLNFLI